MAKRTFNKDKKKKGEAGGTTTVVEDDAGDNAKPVKRKAKSTTVATKAHAPKRIEYNSKGLEGEFTTDDLATPYLSLVGKTGDLSDEFDPGCFVYDKELEISDGDKKNPFELTVIKMKRIFIEYIEYGEEGTPEEFASLNDAIDAGWHNEYEDRDDGRYVIPKLIMVVLIEVDEELQQFAYGKKSYALAAWILQKSGYTSSGKMLYRAALKGHLRDCVWAAPWDLWSHYEEKKVKDFKYYVPKVKKCEAHDKKFIKFLEKEVVQG